MAKPIIGFGEAQAFARIETGEEEAIVAGLVRTASALCEAFIGRIVIERAFAVSLAVSPDWQRLPVSPVRSIDSVATVGSDGVDAALPANSYAIDIDSNGDGWVRVTGASCAGALQVGGTAGMATQENEVPEPIRQGVLRLVAHLYTARDGDGADIPAAVAALWRPYRRTRLA